MNQNLIFGILFLKILFWKYNFFIFVQTCQGTSSEFFLISGLLAESLKAKKITHFIIQFCSKSLTHFTNLNSLDIENNILLQHSPEPFWVYSFFRKDVSVWCPKKKLHHFLKLVRKFLFHRRSKILFGGFGWGEIE